MTLSRCTPAASATAKTSMKTPRLATLFATLLLASAPAWAVKPFAAEYQANIKGTLQADAQMTLASAGADRWNYVLSVDSPVASVRQATVFEERGGDWRPLSGSDTTQMMMKKSQKYATYDWAKGEARWNGDVKPDRVGPVKLQSGDLDAMLLNLAIVRDVAAGKPLNYRLVDNGVVRTQAYQNLGKDTVTFPGRATAQRDQGQPQHRQQAGDRVGRRWPARAGADPAAQGRQGRTRPGAEVGSLTRIAGRKRKAPRCGAFFCTPTPNDQSTRRMLAPRPDSLASMFS